MNSYFLNFSHFSDRKISRSWEYSTLSQGFFLALFCGFLSLTSVQASDLQIEIVDSWVEDGYIFHVDFQIPPYTVNCVTTGAGFIGFNVYYKDTHSLQEDWTFGLAPWPNGVWSDSKVKSHLTAYGPQGFCTKFSPCTIQNVQMVKAWCPPLGGVSDSTE
jgi:hypothetical protein